MEGDAGSALGADRERLTHQWRQILTKWIKHFADAQASIRQLEHDVRVLRGAIDYLAEVLTEEQISELAERFNERSARSDM